MIGSTALDLLMSRLGNRNSATLRAKCVLEMQLIQQTTLEQCDFFPWFLQDESMSITTTAGVESVSVPTDFIGIDDEWGHLSIYSPSLTSADKWIKLARGTYTNMVERYATDDLAQPVQWDLVNESILLRPIPDQAYTLKLKYYKRAALPTDSGNENSWLKYAPDWLIAETGAYVAGLHLQNSNLAKTFASDAQVAKGRLFVASEARRHTGRDYQMGDS